MKQLLNVRSVYDAARDIVPASGPAKVFNVGDVVTVGFDNEWSSIEVKIEEGRGTVSEGCCNVKKRKGKSFARCIKRCGETISPTQEGPASSARTRYECRLGL